MKPIFSQIKILSEKQKLKTNIKNETVNIPLVLHGGSGLTDNDFRRAIKEGISKVNIFTDIKVAAAKAQLNRFTDEKKGA